MKSDTQAAQSAVSKFKQSNKRTGKTYSLSESNIKGMKRALELTNKIVGEFVKFEAAIQKQAEKFPKLAKVIEQRDQKEARQFSKNGGR